MKFGILVFDQAEELDFAGPWEMLTMWSRHVGGPETCLIVAEQEKPVICAKGLSINPHVGFEECPALDYLLIPGGQGTRREIHNPALLSFVTAQAENCRTVLSVCTGSFILHAAGLLSGKRATTYWGSLDRLRSLGDVEVVEDRFVQDGDIWSSAGVSAGTDMMLAFIASVAGEETAGRVQLLAEYYPSTVRYGRDDTHADAPGYVTKG